jgi:DNA mismatch repair protein MutL
MIIDQYRASVRIMFERYLNQTAGHNAVPQRVLFPEVIQFSPSESALIETILPDLTALGFDLADLGGGSFAVNAIPAGVDCDPVSLVRSIVAEAAEQGRGVLETANERLALSLARSTAVPHGQVLSNEEMETIVNQLFSCSNVNYTPDGRAILCILPQADIEHLLG